MAQDAWFSAKIRGFDSRWGRRVPPFRRTSGSEPPKLGGSVRLRAGAPGRCREDYTLDRVFTPLAALSSLSSLFLFLYLSVYLVRFGECRGDYKGSGLPSATRTSFGSPAGARGPEKSRRTHSSPSRSRVTFRGDGSVAEHEGATLGSRVRSPVTAPTKFAECDQGLQVKTARSIGFKPRNASASPRTSLSLSSAISRRESASSGHSSTWQSTRFGAEGCAFESRCLDRRPRAASWTHRSFWT